MFDRLIKLIGKEKFDIIQKTRVLIVGIGGVGSYALEALARNGFIDITIVEPDIIDITNLNRQLYTEQKNIGMYKADEAKKRCLRINPEVCIKTIKEKLCADNIGTIFSNRYDYVIDACDDVTAKILLISLKDNFNYKLISSMGTAKKNDPTKLEIIKLKKTVNDPLAKTMRIKAEMMNCDTNVDVVSSSELPQEIENLGSNNLVPSVAGLLCCSYIYNDILKRN